MFESLSQILRKIEQYLPISLENIWMQRHGEERNREREREMKDERTER